MREICSYKRRENVLKVHSLYKSFGVNTVINNLNLEVPEHTIYGFAGANGAGKTTTMKMILGLMKPDSGDIEICGEKMHYGVSAAGNYTGYLPDVPEYYPFMTAGEYLVFCGEISGMKKSEAKERSKELLRMVGLEDSKKRIRGFSRGMKQRLGIAQALFNRPRLLICDEPTSALDPAGRREILDILLDARKHTTVLFSTHILSDAEYICDRVAFISNGRIVKEGSIQKLKSEYAKNVFEVEFYKYVDVVEIRDAFNFAVPVNGTTVRFEKGENMQDVMRVILYKGLSLKRMERCDLTLEDVFFRVCK